MRYEFIASVCALAEIQKNLLLINTYLSLNIRLLILFKTYSPMSEFSL